MQVRSLFVPRTPLLIETKPGWYLANGAILDRVKFPHLASLLVDFGGKLPDGQGAEIYAGIPGQPNEFAVGTLLQFPSINAPFKMLREGEY